MNNIKKRYKIISNSENLQILHEDNHVIIVNKRPGDIVQGDKTGDKPLSEVVKEYLKKKYNKPGAVYLGVTHRLDRPTSGAVIFTKTSKALSRMNILFLNNNVEKIYCIIVKNKPEKHKDSLINWLKISVLITRLEIPMLFLMVILASLSRLIYLKEIVKLFRPNS